MKGKKDPKIFLLHIIESIKRIEEDTVGLSEVGFFGSQTIQDAVMRRVSIIGEAVKNLPESLKKKYSKVEWKKIAGMRDVLIHDYFGVETELVWGVVKKDIPKLKKQILTILKKYK